MDDTCKLLCVGDIHLGLSPSRLPADVLAEAGRDLASLGPAEGLRRAVELALDERVDAVLFAGDVVESERDFFEAYPILRRAVQRLVDAGIDVVAVAGNHDVQVLPRLAHEVPGLTLLGRGGRWESCVIRRAGAPIARVVGWSFPERIVTTSPLATFPEAWLDARFDDGEPPDLPTLGLLHADLLSSSSVYAPVARAELEARPLRAWILGHVHRPDRAGLAAQRPIGYLGSLVGLDPGEPGAHGPWLAHVSHARARIEQRPLAPLRWEALELGVDECADVETLEHRLLSAVAELHRRLAPTLGGAVLVGLRVRLVGSSRLPRAAVAARLERLVGRGDEGGLRIEHDRVHYFVEHAADDSRPDRPLDELARRTDPVGLVARRLLALEANDDAGRAAVRAARVALRESRHLNHRNLADVGGAEVEHEEIRSLLLRAARSALEELLAQCGEEGDPSLDPLAEVRA